MDTPVSKSQKRALDLLSLPATDSYQAAARSLETIARPDGIPQGHNWRTAAKLSDAELIAGIMLSTDYDDDGDTGERMRQ